MYGIFINEGLQRYMYGHERDLEWMKYYYYALLLFN